MKVIANTEAFERVMARGLRPEQRTTVQLLERHGWRTTCFYVFGLAHLTNAVLAKEGLDFDVLVRPDGSKSKINCHPPVVAIVRNTP